MMLDIVKVKRDELLETAKQRGAKNVRVFGSVVRGEETPDSDIDFLVVMERGRSLVDMSGSQQDFSRILSRNVDIIAEDGINHYLKAAILAEAEPI